MKNEFKYLTAFAAFFVAILFFAGTLMNVSGGRESMAMTTGVVTLFFISLAVIFYKRANRRSLAKFIEEQKAKAEMQANSKVKLPIKDGDINRMDSRTAKITKLIHLAIDHADEADFDATRILLQQAEDQMDEKFLAIDGDLLKCKEAIQQIKAYMIEHGQ